MFGLFFLLGFVVGNAGVLETILQYLVAYVILFFTIMSICAISTNGAVEGGGAYCKNPDVLSSEEGGSATRKWWKRSAAARCQLTRIFPWLVSGVERFSNFSRVRVRFSYDQPYSRAGVWW